MGDADGLEGVDGRRQHPELGETWVVQAVASSCVGRLRRESGAARRRIDGGPLGRADVSVGADRCSGDRASVLRAATLPLGTLGRERCGRRRLTPRRAGGPTRSTTRLPRRRRRPAGRAGLRRADGVRAARRRRVVRPDDRRQGRAGGDGRRRVPPLRAAARPAARARRRARGRRWSRSSPALEAFHERTAPGDWLEGLVKAYVGDGIAEDFYREVVGLPRRPSTRDLVLDGARGHRPLDVRGRPGPRRDRGGPAARRPARAVGSAAGGRGAEPGAAGRRRARRAGGAARRRGVDRPAPTWPRWAGCSPGSPRTTPGGWRRWACPPDLSERGAPRRRESLTVGATSRRSRPCGSRARRSRRTRACRTARPPGGRSRR